MGSNPTATATSDKSKGEMLSGVTSVLTIPKRPFVIWGLRSVRHSHRFIHEGFYRTLKDHNADVVWLDDTSENLEQIRRNSVIFAVNVAAEYLTHSKSHTYVLHNFEDPQFTDANNSLNLQVYTNQSKGVRLDSSIALYSAQDKVLYQPWGLSESQSTWRSPQAFSKYEYWVGSIWNNSLNQGNKKVIAEYVSVLKERNVKFKRVGGTRTLLGRGITPERALKKISKSRYGCAIVGNWQQENSYLPCRLFKNVAAGKIPSSNGDYAFVFGELGIFDRDLDSLLNRLDAVGISEYRDRVLQSQQIMERYTYTAGLKRILSVVP